jgi:hypothetical protein
MADQAAAPAEDTCFWWSQEQQKSPRALTIDVVVLTARVLRLLLDYKGWFGA